MWNASSGPNARVRWPTSPEVGPEAIQHAGIAELERSRESGLAPVLDHPVQHQPDHRRGVAGDGGQRLKARRDGAGRLPRQAAAAAISGDDLRPPVRNTRAVFRGAGPPELIGPGCGSGGRRRPVLADGPPSISAGSRPGGWKASSGEPWAASSGRASALPRAAGPWRWSSHGGARSRVRERQAAVVGLAAGPSSVTPRARTRVVVPVAQQPPPRPAGGAEGIALTTASYPGGATCGAPRRAGLTRSRSTVS